jgi:hypothetical protein
MVKSDESGLPLWARLLCYAAAIAATTPSAQEIIDGILAQRKLQ